MNDQGFMIQFFLWLSLRRDWELYFYAGTSFRHEILQSSDPIYQRLGHLMQDLSLQGFVDLLIKYEVTSFLSYICARVNLKYDFHMCAGPERRNWETDSIHLCAAPNRNGGQKSSTTPRSNAARRKSGSGILHGPVCYDFPKG